MTSVSLLGAVIQDLYCCLLPQVSCCLSVGLKHYEESELWELDLQYVPLCDEFTYMTSVSGQ